MLHTDEDNLKLITDHYPDFLTVYRSYNEKIKRIDSSRYFYLHHYGLSPVVACSCKPSCNWNTWW